MSQATTALRVRLSDLQNLSATSSILHWDQETQMPSGGGKARASQLGTLARLSHEMWTSDETRELLGNAEREGSDLAVDRGMIRVARRKIERSLRLPSELVSEIAQTSALAQPAWAKARAENDYKAFQPWLEKNFALKREYARAIGFKDKMYDALLDEFEEGATCAEIDPCFAKLREGTVPLIRQIRERSSAVSDTMLRQSFDLGTQESFVRSAMVACGYDFSRGRMDRAVHPFCTSFSRDDVRITTRFQENWWPAAFFACMHEMGHALYEMGIDPALDGTPVGGGTSLGVHESQSRFWENMIGRSVGFWESFFPRLQKAFPAQFGGVTREEFYRSINRVSPSFIRVEADEVTYNLHVVIRYEMENELLEGRLAFSDAPAAWNQKMKDYLGVTPPTDREGIMQDVHWSIGAIGYFPTYTLGNVLASQFYEAALKAQPEIPAQIARGEFSGVRGWLAENIHRHGKVYAPKELVVRATGRPLDVSPYLNYLCGKFSAVYGV